MTDYYSECEAALIALLQTITEFFPNTWQVSDDDTVIQNGAEVFAIFQPGSFPAVPVNALEQDVAWNIIFDLYVAYSTKHSSLPKFKAVRSAIFNLVHPSSLNDVSGVYRTILTGEGSIMQDIEGENPNFIIQTMTAVVTQRIKRDF